MERFYRKFYDITFRKTLERDFEPLKCTHRAYASIADSQK